MKNSKNKLFKIIFGNKFIIAGLILLVIDFIIGIIGQFWTPYPLTETFAISAPPSLAHILGTDEFGQDVLSVMMKSTLPSLLVGVLSGALIAIISTLIGLLGGYYGGKISGVIIDIITTTTLTIPGVVLLVVIESYFRAGSVSINLTLSYIIVIIGLAITSWAFGAKQIRAQVLSISKRDYIVASRLIGEKSWRIIFEQIFPSILPLSIAQFLFGVLYGILSLITAEYWGVLPANINNLGTMLFYIASNAAYLSNQWWWILGAIIPIIILGSGLGLINIGIDEFIDPRLKEVRPTVVPEKIIIPIEQGLTEIPVIQAIRQGYK
ncbi:ABC transporter permease [Sulfolobus tengchongensis]|uniref:ABC transporter permease n=1 Tax=Sulfolobus tengchongensis TaxID=207809 RepID=A0AAX4L552_9CREN